MDYWAQFINFKLLTMINGTFLVVCALLFVYIPTNLGDKFPKISTKNNIS